jgi:hypothetical protein
MYIIYADNGALHPIKQIENKHQAVSFASACRKRKTDTALPDDATHIVVTYTRLADLVVYKMPVVPKR